MSSITSIGDRDHYPHLKIPSLHLPFGLWHRSQDRPRATSKPPFRVTARSRETHRRNHSTTLVDSRIDPPSLLTVPVKSEIPVHVDATWSPQ